MERSDFLMRMLSPKLRYCLSVAVLALAAMVIAAVVTDGPTFLSAQTAEPSVMEQTDAAAATEVEIQQRFNELRGELLDDRSDTVEWWLAATAIFVTLFGVGAVLVGYFGFNRLREIAEEARGHLQAIEKHREQSQALVQDIRETTSEDIQDPTKAERLGAAVRDIQRNPAASPLDRGVADAYALQRDGKTREAKEKWRAIANIVEGTDKDRAARAWLSVGYLSSREREGGTTVAESALKDAIHAFNRAIALKPDYAAAYSNRAAANGGLGRYEDAIADCDQAIRLDPDLAGAYINRGNAKSALGREDALADLDQAVRLTSGVGAAYVNRGIAKDTLGLFEDAIADFDQAIRLNPDDVEAYICRGLTRDHLGQQEDAIADFDRATRLDSRNAEAYSNRGDVKHALGQNQEAVRDYDEAIRLEPGSFEAYNNRGNAKSVLGRHEDAIVDYDEAIRLKPDLAEAYSNRGTVKSALGQLEEAAADFDQAISLKPDLAEAYSNRSEAKIVLGRYREAIDDCDQAIRLDPDSADPYSSRGVARAALGDVEGARSDFATALDLARRVGNDRLTADIEQRVQELDDTGEE